MRIMHKEALENQGKTPNLCVILTQAPAPYPRTTMFSIVAQVAHFLRSSAAPIPASPAAALMESADACAGIDAHHAQELRVAASAWLRVVR